MRVSAKRLVGGAMVAGGAVAIRPGTRANKVVCHQIDVASRRLRYASGQLQGLSYRLRGGHPSPDVADNVLADRIRSELGRLEKRLDLPHVHVMVDSHVAVLHGEVGTYSDTEEIERAVQGVYGVAGVESYLHVGLGRGDSRPSAGRQIHAPSEAMHLLIESAVGAGIEPGAARVVVRAVLGGFAERLPEHERAKVAGHLPADVRAMFTPPRRARRPARARSIDELLVAIAATTRALPVGRAERVTTDVVRTLHDLVPEEAREVGAVLPVELRTLWQGEGRAV